MSVNLVWTSGFNGGHKQTFIVNYQKMGLQLASLHHLSLTLVMDKKSACLLEILKKHRFINSLSERKTLMMDYPPATHKQKYLKLKVNTIFVNVILIACVLGKLDY